MTTTQTSTGAVPVAFEPLDDTTRGAVVTPEHAGYEQARSVYNAMIDKRPAAVLQAAGVADVMAGVRFARDHGLEVAIRGGGHHVAGFGTCDGGLVIDLGRLRGVRVDPRAGTVRAEGGCTVGDLDHAAHAIGLAVPLGTVSTTGIAGLTLGGGMGFLARRWGLSCDNLLSADVVTADGRLVTTDRDTHPELFWALRGGGGNFGVVTSFEYRAHPLSQIVGGPTFFPIGDGEVLRRYRDWLPGTPEELGALFVVTLAPDAPFVDERWRGRPVCGVLACWTGQASEAAEVLAPVLELGQVVGRFVEPVPYPVINTLFDELLPPGLRHYWKGDVVTDLRDAAVAAHVEHGARVPAPESAVLLFPVDGAVHRVGPDETAFPHRSSRWATVYAGTWREAVDDERNIAWVRDYHEALRPFADGSRNYVNFTSADDAGRLADNFGANLGRLAGIKAAWDPENVFRRNQNVVPATA